MNLVPTSGIVPYSTCRWLASIGYHRPTSQILGRRRHLHGRGGRAWACFVFVVLSFHERKQGARMVERSSRSSQPWRTTCTIRLRRPNSPSSSVVEWSEVDGNERQWRSLRVAAGWQHRRAGRSVPPRGVHTTRHQWTAGARRAPKSSRVSPGFRRGSTGDAVGGSFKLFPSPLPPLLPRSFDASIDASRGSCHRRSVEGWLTAVASLGTPSDHSPRTDTRGAMRPTPAHAPNRSTTEARPSAKSVPLAPRRLVDHVRSQVLGSPHPRGAL